MIIPHSLEPLGIRERSWSGHKRIDRRRRQVSIRLVIADTSQVLRYVGDVVQLGLGGLGVVGVQLASCDGFDQRSRCDDEWGWWWRWSIVREENWAVSGKK